LEQLTQIINQMQFSTYIAIASFLLLIISSIFLLLTNKEKNALKSHIDHNIKSFQKIFDTSHDAVIILSIDNNILYANRSMSSFLHLHKDFTSKPLPMPQIKDKKEWIPLDKFIHQNHTRLQVRPLFVPQTSLKKANETEEVAINLYIETMIIDKNHKRPYKIITIQDLSKEHERARLQYIHQLTGLPNDVQAVQDLPTLFSKVHLENNKIALILISLDNFIGIRSVLGYEKSNDVLIKFTKYLESFITDLSVTVYHTSENHFLLTVSNVSSVEDIKKFVERIQIKTVSFYKVENMNLHFSISSGIAVYPDSGTTRQLLDNVYKALTLAENEGHGRIAVYIPEESKNNFDELSLHNDMQTAIERGEFEVYYQAIVNSQSKELASAEALIRWNHPTYGMISPEVFIPLMEKTGFIITLGQFVLEEVLKQQKRWELFDFKRIEVSINVSMVEINTGEFVQNVKEKIESYGIPFNLIKFEITEGVAMLHEGNTKQYFLDLKKLGVGISLDDFGTGYTSFTYLKKFPATVLKIDKSLVDNILTNKEDQGIVKGMITLGHNLGMKIVVEGIETEKMVEMLASFGCDYMQGFYFAKPLPVFEFQKLLR